MSNSNFQRLIDTLIDRIILFSDYFIIHKHVTLSEAVAFMFAASWTLWFLIVGVYVSEAAISKAIWVTVFMMATVTHFISFFFKDILARALVVSGYAVMWCFLAILSAYTGSHTPAVPTLAVFTALSVFLAVRLFRERSQQHSK